MIIKLHTPIKDLTGKQVTSLTARDHITAGDILQARRAHADGLERDYALLASMVGLDMKEFADLDMRDVQRLDSHMASIMAPLESDPAPKP